VAFLIKRAVIITNPASRQGKRLAEHARMALASRSVECDVVFTERPGHAAELASRFAPQYDAVFALGGDGTVMEVAGALAGTNVRVGVLAGGTGNLLARALGIPLSVKHAVRSLLEGGEIFIDVGRFESGKKFAIAAGVGIDASMVAETPGWLKRRLGVVAYAIIGGWAALRAVLKRELFDVRLVIDGTTYEGEAAAVMIANFGAVLGKRLTLGPEIRTDDGVLDACVFSPRSLRDALRITWRMLRANFSNDPALTYRRGCHIRVETFPPRPWQADGELMGMTPFSVQVEPRAVRLLVPRER